MNCQQFRRMFVTQASLPPCVFLRWRVLKITRAVNQKECGSPKSFKNGTSTGRLMNHLVLIFFRFSSI
ncbi:hypothetical protein ACOSQ3_029322 [Xanthoceras sorbifolium]